MIITTDNGKTIDTATDLTPEERHILQKLFAWKSMAHSLAQFKEVKDRAMKKGWNNSGPVQESRPLKMIIQHLEKDLIQRLKKTPGP
ncbi:hypothetical protein [Desulfobacula sp.]|uniref:hypothetical protein n=1 Tax=Desulfobacula sp. TaxID=2593537 RepID=UPI002630BE42|nr:hypothetical protein [Desulfobacula sp.]